MLQGYCRGSWVVQWYTDTVVVQGYTVTEFKTTEVLEYYRDTEVVEGCRSSTGLHWYKDSTRMQGCRRSEVVEVSFSSKAVLEYVSNTELQCPGEVQGKKVQQ